MQKLKDVMSRDVKVYQSRRDDPGSRNDDARGRLRNDAGERGRPQ